MDACIPSTSAGAKIPIAMLCNSASERRGRLVLNPWGLSRKGNSTSRGKVSSQLANQPTPKQPHSITKRCLRCNWNYLDEENGPQACSYHGHMNGDRGLFSLAPPHQGIDGEWTDASGVIVYKWNEKDKRPNTGMSNWKKRWSCCGEYDDMAVPCRRGWHVSYDDGGTLF